MNTLEPKESILLVESDGLRVIRIKQYTTNLRLRTLVRVNTTTNETVVNYNVIPWDNNDLFKHICKSFDNYQKAIDYYNKVLNDHPNVINKEAVDSWWKKNSFIKHHFESKYPNLNLNKEEDIWKLVNKELFSI